MKRSGELQGTASKQSHTHASLVLLARQMHGNYSIYIWWMIMFREQNKGENLCGHGEIYVMEFLSSYEPGQDVWKEGKIKREIPFAVSDEVGSLLVK